MKQLFRRQLTELGLCTRPIKADGHCLFRSVSDLIDGDQDISYLLYRKIAVDYMRLHPSKFSPFLSEEEAAEGFSAYLEKMANTSAYGSHVEMIALSTLLDLQFIVHEYQQPPLLVRDSEDRLENSKTLHLAYDPIMKHYDSVRKLGDKSNKQAESINFSLTNISELQIPKQNKKKVRNNNSKSQQSLPSTSTATQGSINKKNSASQPISKKKETPIPFIWKSLPPHQKLDLDNFSNTFSNRVTKKVNYRAKFRDLKEPIDFFELFFTEELLDLITHFTNQRATALRITGGEGTNGSHRKAWKNCTKQELKAYIALLIHMGITKAPSYPFYWIQDPKFRIDGIASLMKRDRFLQLKRCLFFSENDLDDSDKINRIRPIFNILAEKCEKFWIPYENLSLDESMVGYKGKHSGKVYIPTKPIRNGFKIFVLSSFEGYVLKFIPSFLFGDKTTVEQIVFSLVSGYEGKGYNLHMDR